MRAALYYRVSTPGQVDAFGYDAQKRLLPEYAARQGWEITGEYEEPGISGEFITLRPAMLELLADAARDRFDVILAIEDSRLSRGDLTEWQILKTVCDQNEVSLATPQGVFYRPGNDDDDFTTDIRGAVSKAEKRRIAKRLMRGKEEALRQGRLPHGQAPFGYRFVRCGEKRSHKRLEIVEEQAEVVRTIFHLAVHGEDRLRGPLGTIRIAAHLTDVLQVPSPRDLHWGRSTEKQAAQAPLRWPSSTVLQILRNDVYRGAWQFGKHRNCAPERPVSAHPKCPGRSSRRLRDRSEWKFVTDPEVVPAIVSEELWQAAQVALTTRHSLDRGRPRERTERERPLLVSFLTCPHCGLAFNYYPGEYKKADGTLAYSPRYACNGRYKAKQKGDPVCQNGRWNQEDVDAAVWAEVVKLVQSPDLLLSIVEARQAEQDPDLDSREPDVIARNLEGIDGKISRVKSAYAAGVYSLEELAEEIAKIRAEREILERRLTLVQAKVAEREAWEDNVTTAITQCRQYAAVIDRAHGATRRQILADLVDRVTLSADGDLRIYLIFDTTRTAAVIKETTCSSSLPYYRKLGAASRTFFLDAHLPTGTPVR